MRPTRSVRHFVISSLLLSITGPAVALEAPLETALATVANRIAELAAPQAEAGLLSGILLVASGNDVLFARGYGYADWELAVPVSSSTRFGVASVTKAMTETLVHVLVDADRLELDAPVERYLPGFPRGPGGGVPTVRHLLTHRAGVPHRVTEPMEEARAFSPSEIVERVRVKGLLFEPGSRQLYSSAGFTCLARVIEVATGRPFASELEERVFRPAGMGTATSETGPLLMRGRATPYRLGAAGLRVAIKAAPVKDLRFLTGAGSVYASAEDLLRFVRAIRSGVFGEAIARELFGGDPTAWRGLTGRTNGFEASVDLLPRNDLTFVFLSNLQSAANWRLRQEVRELLAGHEATAIPLPPGVAVRFEEPADLLGTYGGAEITSEDGQLFRGENEFYPIDGERYYVPASGTTMRFRRDADGRVDALVSTSGGDRETVLEKS